MRERRAYRVRGKGALAPERPLRVIVEGMPDLHRDSLLGESGVSLSSGGTCVRYFRMPKIDIDAVQTLVGTLYPPPYDEPCRARERQRLGDAAGLTQFGVNVLLLPPGAWSSQRHFHSHEDELVYVLEGEVTLVTDQGSEVLRAGDAAGFKAGDGNGHCLKNLSDRPARVLEVGSRVADDSSTYPDLDLLAPAGGKPAVFTHKDGTPYLDIRRRGPGG